MLKLYNKLLSQYGSQGWWPLLCDESLSGRQTLYHPHDYTIPRNELERLEICIGAILTQNTNWRNVEKALRNLKDNGLISIKEIISIEQDKLADLIKPSGYYNQKAKKLKVLCDFLYLLGDRIPHREELLTLWGIGKETADSILLYAWHENIMVIDSYCRKVLKEHGYNCWDLPYDELRILCEKVLPQDFKILQEFHALLVAAGKDLRSRRIKAQ